MKLKQSDYKTCLKVLDHIVHSYPYNNMNSIGNVIRNVICMVEDYKNSRYKIDDPHRYYYVYDEEGHAHICVVTRDLEIPEMEDKLIVGLSIRSPSESGYDKKLMRMIAKNRCDAIYKGKKVNGECPYHHIIDMPKFTKNSVWLLNMISEKFFFPSEFDDDYNLIIYAHICLGGIVPKSVFQRGNNNGEASDSN